MALAPEKRAVFIGFGALAVILLGSQLISYRRATKGDGPGGVSSPSSATGSSSLLAARAEAAKKGGYYTVPRYQVYFDIAPFAEHAGGRISFELYNDVVPATAENFRRLCVGNGGATHEGIPRSFKGSRFHRIIPKFVVQGGDFTRGDGTGGASIYGRPFADENFTLKHDAPGLLSMANSGVNTNESQFFITLAAFPHLDGHHVVFGHVTSGFDIVKAMESFGTQGGAPSANITIQDAGELTR